MRVRLQMWLWLAQRVSAAVLAVCIVVHLVTMIYAVRGGLSAAEILARTQGNYAWFAFYTVFVLAVSIHAPIGLRTVLAEMLGWRGVVVNMLTLALGITSALAGMRAVLGVFS
ncbi:MAG: succinate dehydrogenase [Betaproteobacteria bacterium]